MLPLFEQFVKDYFLFSTTNLDGYESFKYFSFVNILLTFIHAPKVRNEGNIHTLYRVSSQIDVRKQEHSNGRDKRLKSSSLSLKI